MRTRYTLCKLIAVVLCMALNNACDDFVKVDPPRTDLVKSTVFSSDNTALSAMLDIYYQMRTNGFASGDILSISLLNSLTSDELINYYVASPQTTEEFKQFAGNTLNPANSRVYGLWSQLYKCVYKSNAILEGLSSSSEVSENLKRQLQGEARFIRAFCYFYLVNLFGDVPLVLTTDYRINSQISRTVSDDVYHLIIEDLKNAQDLLSADYSYSNTERVRPNKGAATALLARVYLYVKDWANAEEQATTVITDNSRYSLVANVSAITTKNNTEAIWQLWGSGYPNDLFTFYVVTSPPRNVSLQTDLVDAFEVGDQRRTSWVGSFSTYYFPRKYSSFTLTEYSTVLRLAEQFLIRAEARAQMDNVSGGQEDLNTVRHRAALGDTPANDKASLLLAVEQERRVELFTEWGHRWFDLKRTNRADDILSSVKPQWASTAALLPLPEYELRNNPSLQNAQNPGY
jgi:starch-binding outer membrane protein, SusD/RagB family